MSMCDTEETRARKFIEDTLPILDTLDGQHRDLAMRGLRRARAIISGKRIRTSTRIPRHRDTDQQNTEREIKDTANRSESGRDSVREPTLEVPTERDCQYLVHPGRVEEIGDYWSQITKKVYNVPDPIAWAIRQWGGNRRGIPLRILAQGGDLGTCSFGGGYTEYSTDNATWKINGTYANPEVEVLGVLEDARNIKHPENPFLRLNFHSKYGRCGGVKLHNIGIKGHNDSFIVRSLGYTGKVELVGCWWVPYSTSWMHTSGMHLSEGYEHLIVRNMKINDDALFKEHDFYPKGGGPIYILDCDILGGCRTFLHARPHVGADGIFGPDIPDKVLDQYPYNTPRQLGAVVVRRNKAIDPQWKAWQRLGKPIGAAATVITVWGSLGGCYIEDNEITNALGGCVLLGWQPNIGVGNYVNEHGFNHTYLSLKGNKTTSPAGDVRPTIDINSCERVVIGANEADSNGDILQLDGEIAYKWGGPMSDEISFTDRNFPEQIANYDRTLKKLVKLTKEEVLRKYAPSGIR